MELERSRNGINLIHIELILFLVIEPINTRSSSESEYLKEFLRHILDLLGNIIRNLGWDLESFLVP